MRRLLMPSKQTMNICASTIAIFRELFLHKNTQTRDLHRVAQARVFLGQRPSHESKELPSDLPSSGTTKSKRRFDLVITSTLSNEEA